MENEQKAKYLITYFNMKKSKSFRVSNTENSILAQKCLELVDGEVTFVKAFIDNYEGDNIKDCFESFIYQEKTKQKEKEERLEAAKAIEVKSAEESSPELIGKYMGLLEAAMAKVIVETQGERIAQGVMVELGKKVDDYIKDNYGPIERKIVVKVGDAPAVEFKGILHEKFDTVLKFVSNKEPVFLSGPAGSGKNVLCKQVADALKLPFYFTNAVTQEYKITGFTDAMGVYHETQFYKAFKNGGLFMLDEMDASIPEVLVILNAAIANGYFDFPAPIGYVEAHPDFRVIAAGNTFGLGADYEYVGRNQLDMASLDRFALVRVDYSESIEEAITNGNKELVSFARDFRDSCKSAGVQMVVSYRALQRIAKMESLIGVKETLETCLVKNLGKDEIKNVLSNMKTSNKYSESLKEIAK